MALNKRLIGEPRVARLAGVAVTAALLASACSGSADSETAATSPPPDPPPSSAESGSGNGDASSPDAGAQPAAGHVFPDLDTVNIADGSTVNLADELAGGDTPVLFWFFAPH